MNSHPEIPADLSLALDAATAQRLAEVFGGQAVYPNEVRVHYPGEESSAFSSWDGPVLLLEIENQSVCEWGIALDRPGYPVLVAGDLADCPDLPGLVVHAVDLATHIAARRWDDATLNHGMLLQANAGPLPAETLAVLTRHYRQGPRTAGFPGALQYRFEDDGLRLLLWASSDQCDWWLAGEPAAMARLASSVPGVPVDLFMSNELDDEQVAALLRGKS